MPELAEAWRAEHGRCFELLGVAEESAREDVVAAAREVPYPVLLDKDAVALDRWGVEGYPTTFLVDADGKIRRVFHGPVDRGELSEAVRPLLPASCPRS
ncbi:MAG TPA: TlpA disulfide reductase family protein, partial [Anaeromyxobacter sp.]|nr:TlpA disulfide reductase family protein [Anaeromyxobacter sp.]